MRPGDQGNDLGDEVDGGELDCRAAVTPRLSEPVENLFILRERKTFLGDGTTQDVATQLLESTPVERGDAQPGVKIETMSRRVVVSGVVGIGSDAETQELLAARSPNAMVPCIDAVASSANSGSSPASGLFSSASAPT